MNKFLLLCFCYVYIPSGAEVNWGFRFHKMDSTEQFVRQLAAEVATRLEEVYTHVYMRMVICTVIYIICRLLSMKVYYVRYDHLDLQMFVFFLIVSYYALFQAGRKGQTATLKLLKRSAGAGQPVKSLGHGHCDSLSRFVLVFCANLYVYLTPICGIIYIYVSTRIEPNICTGQKHSRMLVSTQLLFWGM